MSRRKIWKMAMIGLTIAPIVGIYFCRTGILYDLSVNVFASMIIVWFIDEINERLIKKENKSSERQQVIRADRLLQLYYKRYMLLFYCVVTPIKKRNFSDINIPSDFKLSDMHDLHMDNLLMNEGVTDSSVEVFLNAELALRQTIEWTIRTVSFNYYPEVRQYLEKYIDASITYNSQNSVSSILKSINSKETLHEINKKLETDGDKFYEDYKNGKKQTSNLLHIYVYLYDMMKEELSAMNQYSLELTGIHDSQKD